MKNSIFILFSIYLVACAGKPQEQRFVNPLFYETLEPISRIAWQTKLTPTQVIITNDGYSDIRDCELLENTQDSVSLKCQYRDDPDIAPSIYTYKIIPAEKNKSHRYKGIYVVEEEVEMDGSLGGEATFVIEEKIATIS